MKRMIIMAVLALIIFGGGGYWLAGGHPLRADETAGRESLLVGQGTVISMVKGSSTLEPATELTLSFEMNGLVDEILVERGQLVRAGEPIARLKADDLALQLAQAEADLAQLKAGTRPEEIAAAEAALNGARADYAKVVAGANAEDIAATEAVLSSAWASYNGLLDGPNNNELTVAAANLRTTEIALQQAQSEYDKIAYASNIGQTPQATRLQQATIDHDAALASYNLAVETASDAELSAAWSQVVQAQSKLATLKNSPSAEELSAAQAQVDQAQAQLEKLQNGPTAEALAIAELQVAQAMLTLEKTTLSAPIDGTITTINVDPGEIAAGIAVVLDDLSTLHADVAIDEIDLPAVRIGQPAVITIDALPEQPIEGLVTAIAPAPVQATTGVASYEVTVTLADQPDTARVGMTANVAIETERRENVTLIPAHYIQVDPQTGQTYVEKQAADGRIIRAEVSPGLRSGDQIEVRRGLEVSERVLTPLTEDEASPQNGPFGGLRPGQAAQNFQNDH